jgi:hypothetical protein
MKLLTVLALAAAASLAACAEKSDKPKAKATRTGSGATGDTGTRAAGSATGSGSGSGSGSARATSTSGPTETGTPAAPAYTVTEAKPKLTASLQPIADGIDAAMMHGCMEGADRVAALFRDADDAADELHVMMRDPALRAELAAAIKARQDPAIAKLMSKMDTALVGCKNAAQQARLGLDRLMQPAIIVAP